MVNPGLVEEERESEVFNSETDKAGITYWWVVEAARGNGARIRSSRELAPRTQHPGRDCSTAWCSKCHLHGPGYGGTVRLL